MNTATISNTDMLIQHITNNLTSEDYKHTPFEFDNKFRAVIDRDRVSERTLQIAQENIHLFTEAEAARHEYQRPLVGDYILQPNGEYTRISHIWGKEPESMVQTGNGSFHLSGSGLSSMSGSLNTGVKISDISPTNEFRPATFWLFSRGSVGGNRGVYHTIQVRVWKSDVNESL